MECKISSMYVGHNLGAAYDVWLNYYNGLNQIDKSIGSDAAYDPTKIIVYVLPLLESHAYYHFT